MRGEPEQVLEYWRCCSQHNWYSETYNISYLGTKISCEAARKGTIKDSWICLIWSDPTPMIVTNILELFWIYCIYSYQMSKIFCTVLEPNVEFFWQLQLLCVFVCVLENRGKLFMFQLYPPAAGCCILYDNLLSPHSHCLIVRHCRSSLFLFSSFWILFFDATSNIKASVTHKKS